MEAAFDQRAVMGTIPREGGSLPFPRMSAAERRLLAQAAGDAGWQLLFDTRSRVDVGEWLRNGRVWIGVTSQEVILLAAGRVPFVQKTPLEHVRESLYNPLTGEVVLAPAGELKLKRVKLPALDGYRLLARIVTPAP